jgi:hypothetical protein
VEPINRRAFIARSRPAAAARAVVLSAVSVTSRGFNRLSMSPHLAVPYAGRAVPGA